VTHRRLLEAGNRRGERSELNGGYVFIYGDIYGESLSWASSE